VKTGKPARQLPARGGLKDLDKSQRTILDYGKASPIKPDAPVPNVIQVLANSKFSVK
jgi:hypothetical protein